MKKIFTIQKFLTIALSAVFAVTTIGTLQSCGADGVEAIPNPIPVEHKVQFKLTGTNAAVTKAVVMIGSTTTEFGALSGNTWESEEIKVPTSEGSIALSAYATGSGPASVLKAEIFVDGKLVKFGTASGTDINALAFYTFK
ncbi:MAG: hypothetical protein JSS94_01790 [Bacteroidetes bacterium]|nr:hypothetical protein [Bacteroidota bacterium]